MHGIFYLSNVFVVMPFSNSCLRCRLVRWYFYNEAVARPAHVLARLPHLLPSYHPPPPLLSLSLSTLTPHSGEPSFSHSPQVTIHTEATQSWVFHLHDQTRWFCPSPYQRVYESWKYWQAKTKQNVALFDLCQQNLPSSWAVMSV